MVLALGGSRVLLVDADMRRPGLHTVDRRAERDRPVAPARRPGARPRRGAEDERAEPVRDRRRAHSAQSVGAALLGADERAAREPAVGPVRLGHHRHAAGAGGDRRRDRRARGLGRRVRDRLGDDAARARRARDRNAARPARRSRSARSSTASTSTATGTTTRATTATTTRTTTAPAARNPPDVGGDRGRLLLPSPSSRSWSGRLLHSAARSASTAVSFGVACLVSAVARQRRRPRLGWPGLDRALVALLVVVALPAHSAAGGDCRRSCLRMRRRSRTRALDRRRRAPGALPLDHQRVRHGLGVDRDWLARRRSSGSRARAVPPRRRAHDGADGLRARLCRVAAGDRAGGNGRHGTSTGGSGPSSKGRCPSVRSSTAIISRRG